MATVVIMPRQGQSVESCILVEWLARAGDAVKEGQPLANIETDKAVFEVESPAAGTLLETFFEAGADVPVLTNIAAIGSPGEDVSALRPEGGAAVSGGAPAGSTVASAPAVPAPAAPVAESASAGVRGVSPRARKLASAKGVETGALQGSGPEGRVIARDVQAAAAQAPRMTSAARAAAVSTGAGIPAAGTGPGGLVTTRDIGTAAAIAAPRAAEGAVAPVAPSEIPLSGIRRIIADRMRKSLAGTAQLSMTRVFDATAILDYRAKVKAAAESMAVPNVTINDMIAFATVRTLMRFPELNAHFLGDRVLRFANVNLGVAMDTPRGLMVPVVREADRLSLAGLSRAVKPLADAARQGNINPDALTGGTFTITNMGMLGVETFTPILNAPEVGILGVGGPQLRPAMRGGAVVHVQCIGLSLTVDHQAVDGAPGARFLQALAEALERFELLLCE